MARVNEGSHSSLATHTFIHTWNEPYLPLLQPQSVTALLLVFISRPAKGRKVSWPGWLGKMRWVFFRPKTVTHPITSGNGRESN